MDFDVVILPTFSQAEAWRKEAACECPGGLFAQTVTTFDAWIGQLWELYGDGRSIVEAMRREVMMNVLCQQAGGYFASPGVSPMLARCARDAAGVIEFERALDSVRKDMPIDALASGEYGALGLLARYADQLAESGFVELGEAAAELSAGQAEVFSRPLRVLVAQASELSWIQRQFFSSCDQLEVTVDRAGGADGVSQAPEGVEVRFAFPSGALAEPGLIADVVRQHSACGDVVVTCKDPAGLFDRIMPTLVDYGYDVCVQASVPFSQTDFGRAFMAMYHTLHDVPWDCSLLVDVLHTPFSGASHAEALQIDARLRANRIAERDVELSRLRACYEPFSQLEELASDPDADVLIGVFEQMVQAMQGRSSAWRSEQLGAMAVLRSATSAARGVGADISACHSVLENASLPVSAQAERRACGERKGSVIICSQQTAAQRAQGSCEMLVMADLTSQDYPAADRDDAATTLLGKIGLVMPDDALGLSRRTFSALLGLPTARIVVMRPLGDENANETYASAVLEEFIDAYRADPSATEDIDNPYRLPEELQAGLAERGEELLYENALAIPAGEKAAVSACMPWPRIDGVSFEGRRVIGPRRRNSQGERLDKPCPSPSQIEVYLACPYEWFATRRVGLDGLDEGFGPLERGSFAHGVLEQFYREFQGRGHKKVNSDNLEQARVLMREVIEAKRMEQFREELAGTGRYVPTSELERRDIDALCDQLVAYLDFEAQFLPGFHPEHLEYDIDADDPADYAGAYLVGKVDRIDVDDKGNAVIIDYKGSVGDSYEIAGKTFDDPGKVQTRIYAQVIGRKLGLRVVGALYVSYGRRPAVAGAYDPRVLEAAHLPGIKTSKSACGTGEELPDALDGDAPLSELAFERMLDATEAIAARAIEGMDAGAIAPKPSRAACEYCPVVACPKRGA